MVAQLPSSTRTQSGCAHAPILLVNDEPWLRVLKRSLLLQAGYEV